MRQCLYNRTIRTDAVHLPSRHHEATGPALVAVNHHAPHPFPPINVSMAVIGRPCARRGRRRRGRASGGCCCCCGLLWLRGWEDGAEGAHVVEVGGVDPARMFLCMGRSINVNICLITPH